jgi:manganese transport protein
MRWVGPGILVAVGYMDPGNWATGISAGSQYGYALSWVILASSAMAILLQVLAARLGIVSGQDLVGLGYTHLGHQAGTFLAVTALIAVIATDLAEVLGFALAMQLLFGLPLEAGALLAFIETIFVLSWTSQRPRLLESLIGILTLAIVGIFAYELWVLRPSPAALVRSLLPNSLPLQDTNALYLALGLIGATIMPHNLYLHSAWARAHFPDPRRFSALTSDTVRSLALAFFVNVALLWTAATLQTATQSPTEEWGIAEAYALFEPVVGSVWAAYLFGMALLFSGHNATLTSTLAGQVVLEHLLPKRLSTLWRGLLLRTAAIFPALLALLYWGQAHLNALLVWSQVILSLQLPFVLMPMLIFLRKCPAVQISPWTYGLTASLSFLILSLNFLLLWQLSF